MSFLSTYLNKVFINSQTIQCKSSSFVTAEHIHACHFFNCCHSFCDSSLKNEVKIQKEHSQQHKDLLHRFEL